MEFVLGMQASEELSPKQRFEMAITRLMPKIPLTIRIKLTGTVGEKVNCAEYEIGLFQYILSLSLWRPRDVLTHLDFLYGLQESDGTRERVDDYTLCELLINATNAIIDKEFFTEYRYAFPNIEKVLNALSGQNILSSSKEFFTVLNRIKFVTLFDVDDEKVLEKVKILYELGVIGFWLNEPMQKKYAYNCRSCFIFNEGIRPLQILSSDFNPEKDEISFIINPMFFHRLHLNMNIEEPVGDYSWDYLIKNHNMKHAISRF